MLHKAKGTLKTVHETVKVNDDFESRLFVIEMNNFGKLENVAFELYQARCPLIDEFSIGDTITVSFNIVPKTWMKLTEKKIFITLQAWNIEKGTPGYIPNKYQTTGTLVEVQETFHKEDFERRTFVVEVENLFRGRMDPIPFDLTQNRCKTIDDFNIGDTMTVHFNIRQTKEKFTNLKAFKILKATIEVDPN